MPDSRVPTLPTVYQQTIHQMNYARWLWDENRRETWSETVARYFDFFETHLKERCGFELPAATRKELETAVLGSEVMPSMRCLMTAGPALARDEIAGFNCTYTAIDRPQAFDEILYLLACGTGVGFSVERRYTNKLPVVAETFHTTDTTIMVADSKIGWAKALKELIGLLYMGQVPSWDLSKVRPAGAPLKTFGGRASGPEPLNKLFTAIIPIFKAAAGRQLNPIECHDIVCMIADVIISGGVRRSALISLSDLHDQQMRQAKSGRWWETTPWRALANNSYVIDGQIILEEFIDEWKALYQSKSGERGIFSRNAARKIAAANGRRDASHDFGCNPCSEILLRNMQCCNLSEVIVRADDTHETLKRKVKLATILGTFQSTLTNFRYLSKKWSHNADEERLLGVSMTGIFDNPLMYKLRNPVDEFGQSDSLSNRLVELRQVAIETNEKWAKKLGIPQSTAITCVKPSGNVSQLNNCASGLHPRHAKYYIRRIRSNKTDPIGQFLWSAGVPREDEIAHPDTVSVFAFPQKAPEHALTRHELSALDHLEIWKCYQRFWAEHKPSVTINVAELEWLDVAAWVWKNIDMISGVSFLPREDHIYQQAPYTDCTQEEYEALAALVPAEIDWAKLAEFEATDLTTGAQELACASGFCEIK